MKKWLIVPLARVLQFIAKILVMPGGFFYLFAGFLEDPKTTKTILKTYIKNHEKLA
jgi:hypothetical protein